jgi:hypothetical protein
MSDQPKPTLSGTEGISGATSESAINAACFPATPENKTKQVQVLPAQPKPRKQDAATPTTGAWTIEQMSEQLHVWYLEGTRELDPANYNPKAQKAYAVLNDQQKEIDRHIARKVLAALDAAMAEARQEHEAYRDYWRKISEAHGCSSLTDAFVKLEKLAAARQQLVEMIEELVSRFRSEGTKFVKAQYLIDKADKLIAKMKEGHGKERR